MRRLLPFLLLLTGLVACSKDDNTLSRPAMMAISEVSASMTSVSFYLTATDAVGCLYAVAHDPDALQETDFVRIENPSCKMTKYEVKKLEPEKQYTICAVAVAADGSRTEKRHVFVTTSKPSVVVHRLEPGYDRALLTLSATNAERLCYACVEKGGEAPSEFASSEVAETLSVSGLVPDRDYTLYLYAEQEGVCSEMPVTRDFRTLENPLSVSVGELVASVSSVSIRVVATAADAVYYCLVKKGDPEPEESEFEREEVDSESGTVQLIIPGLLPSENYVVYLFARNKYGKSGVVKSESFETDCENLSEKGRANCYVITTTEPVKYKFDATLKGCSDVSVGKPASAELMWEDAPGLITSVSLNAKVGTVSFVTAGKGNGLIAVKDAADKVLWSWHIWCAGETVGDDSYVNFTGSSPVLMDRNLGAVSAVPYSAESRRSMIYQWGRKDPFPNSEMVYVGEGAVSPSGFLTQWPAVPVGATGDAANNNLVYAVQNPTRFITGTAGWFPTPVTIGAEGSTADFWGNKSGAAARYNGSDGWWSGDKTMFDPCPAGYRVPGVFVVSGFTTTGGDFGNNVIDPATRLNLISSVFSNGWLFKRTVDDSEGTWYPATGCRQNSTGACAEPACIYMWFSGHNTSSATAVPANARTLYSTKNKFRAAAFGKVYAFGCPVRCQRIPDGKVK